MKKTEITMKGGTPAQVSTKTMARITRALDDKALQWRVNTPNLLNEVLINDQTQIFTRPFQVLANLLGQTAQRAAELNDPKLNALMMLLALYDVADPYSANYDADLVDKTLREVKW